MILPRILHDAFKKLRRQESGDLGLLALCLALVPLVWGILLGWHPDRYIMAADGWAMMIPYLRELLAHGGDWTQVIYRPEIQGGAALHDTAGTLLIHQICGFFRLSVTTTANLTVFIAQSGFAFIGTRFAEELAGRWMLRTQGAEPKGQQDSQKQLWLLRALMILLFAFAPVLSWRIFFGHVIMIFGTCVFLGFFALFVAALNARLTLTLLGIVFFMMLQVFPTALQQSIIYGLVFGAPVLLAFCLNEFLPDRRWGFIRCLRTPTLVLVSAILVSMPKFAGLLHHAFGSDAARGVLEESGVVFSHLTMSWRDLWASIPWGLGLIGITSPFEKWHEVNLPVGPFVLALGALLLVRDRSGRKSFAVGLSFCFLVAFLFAANVHPISDLVLTLLPILKSFRVPSRALLPVLAMFPILACAQFVFRLNREPYSAGGFSGWWTAGALCGGAVAMVLLPPFVRELAAWIFVASLFLVPEFVHKFKIPRAMGLVLLFLIALASLLSFKERTVPTLSLVDLEPRFSAVLADIQAHEPPLNSSLVRTTFDGNIAEFSSNSNWMLGVSSVNGYWFPLRRYLGLAMGLARIPADYTIVNLRFRTTDSDFDAVRKLYNVGYRVLIDEAGKYSLEKLAPTLGAAWFAAGIQKAPSMEELARRLTVDFGTLALVDASDEVVQRMRVPEFENQACKKSQASVLVATRGEQGVLLEVKNGVAGCPLAVSMNYMERLSAYVYFEDGWRERELNLFPIYGALTGILVPKIKGHPSFRILIEAVPFVPLWSRLAFYVGLLILGLLVVERLKAGRTLP
ncbi:hypothetical protein WDW86_19310 [Bdellovibrionota bacterium FG-2]